MNPSSEMLEAVTVERMERPQVIGQSPVKSVLPRFDKLSALIIQTDPT